MRHHIRNARVSALSVLDEESREAAVAPRPARPAADCGSGPYQIEAIADLKTVDSLAAGRL